MPVSIHEHPEEWLATSMADGLTPEERRALDAHLAGCAQCRGLQAEYAALDEMLRREMPAAVGPKAGFETRLVAGFRCAVEDEGRWARLRELARWLLSQRGTQFAGVAAGLLGLVSLGQFLTRGELPFSQGPVYSVTNAIQPPRVVKQAEVQLPESSFISGKDESARKEAARVPIQSTLPAGDIEVGRDVTAGAGEVRIPAVAQAPVSGSFAFNAPPPTDTIISAGETLLRSGAGVTNAKSMPPLSLLNGRRISDGIDETSKSNALVTGSTFAGTSGPSAAPAAAPATADATPAPADVRKLIRNARAELEVAAFEAAVDAVTAAAVRDSGFLDTRNSARGGNGKVSGTLVVKVLPENLDRFLTGLRSLGDLKNQTIQTEDVTKDYYDTDARLRNARRMEDRLLKMLDEVKGKMSEVLQVEKELARVRADIETMQGQLKLYDAQVRYATITLSVYEKDLRQPAAFLLRETATLSLLAADVERTAAEVRRIADAAHAQTARSEVSRDPAGKSRATLRLLIAPEAADGVIAQIKALGRVENYRLQDERIAQNGTPDNASAQDPAKVERAPVALELTVSHDEQVSRQVSFTVVAADVDGAFEKARAAATAAGGEVVDSNVARGPAGHATATLSVRVPAVGEGTLVTAWRALGRAGEAETRRVGSGPGAEGGPMLVLLSLTDAEPTVQQTSVWVRVEEVERRAADIKREAVASHASVDASEFSSGTDGRQQAGLTFRLSMKDYPAFIERVRSLGEVRNFTVQRHDRPERSAASADGDAPVAVELTLYRDGRIVGEDSGLGATWRQTFGQGAGALTWSLRMIGVAAAFVAPWVALLVVVVFVARWVRRRSAKKPPSTGQS